MMKIKNILVFAIALLSPIGGALAQTPAPITVTLTDYAFTPSALDMTEGTAYQIHFINAGSKDHSFGAPGFFAASQVAPEDMTKVKNGIVELGNGQSADVTVTPGRAGTYAFICTHFMHEMMGMHGKITVQ
jgi:plastocyanin